MDSSEIIAITIPLMFVGIAFSVVGLPFYMHGRTKDRTRLYEMLRQAQESNHPFSPDLVRQIVGSPPPSRERDIRRGAILLAIAVGLALQIPVAYAMVGDPQERGSIIALLSPFISVLGCVGATMLALGLMLKRPDRDRPGAD
jgi:hypothetical protein